MENEFALKKRRAAGAGAQSTFPADGFRRWRVEETNWYMSVQLRFIGGADGVRIEALIGIVWRNREIEVDRAGRATRRPSRTLYSLVRLVVQAHVAGEAIVVMGEGAHLTDLLRNHLRAQKCPIGGGAQALALDAAAGHAMFRLAFDRRAVLSADAGAWTVKPVPDHLLVHADRASKLGLAATDVDGFLERLLLRGEFDGFTHVGVDLNTCLYLFQQSFIPLYTNVYDNACHGTRA